MNEIQDVAESASPVVATTAAGTARHDWLVQPAPWPDAPAERDRAGAQVGMALAILGCALFWAAAAGVLIYFAR